MGLLHSSSLPPLLKAASCREDCSGPHPVRCWVSPRMETLQPAWATLSCVLNHPVLLDHLISRTVFHGILQSRHLNMKSPLSWTPGLWSCLLAFFPSLQDPELHNLMVIATKTAHEPHNLTSSMLVSMRSSQNTCPYQLTCVKKLPSLQFRNLDYFLCCPSSRYQSG